MKDIIQAWQGKKALVIGDPIEDHYRFGRVERVSQEAPVPIFVEERREIRRGGADNVAANLESLGLQVQTWFPAKPWTTKTRYMAGHHQLLRVDDDIHATGFAPEPHGEPNVIVISDYAKGCCTEQLCQTIIKAATCPVVVDPKGKDWSKYHGCTVICPNTQELDKQEGPLPSLRILQKRGEQGLRLHSLSDFTYKDYPASVHRVFDVTGCGDVVVAVMAATLAAGGDLEVGARLANLAAGWAAGEVGTVACTKDKLCELVLPTAAGTSFMRDTSTSSPSADSTVSTLSSQSIPTNTVSVSKDRIDLTTISPQEFPTFELWPRRSSPSKDGRKL